MSELKRAKDCPSCMAWAQYQGDMPEDWGECKCPKQLTITRADIPESLIAEIKSEALKQLWSYCASKGMIHWNVCNGLDGIPANSLMDETRYFYYFNTPVMSHELREQK